MNPLRNFYTNEHQRESVREFMVVTLKDMLVDTAFRGEDVGGFKEANELINKVFNKLEEEYGKIESSEIPNSR